MPWRPSASDQVRASAICPTAAAAWLFSSRSVPLGSLSTARPSAIAPEETTRMSRVLSCSSAISSASEASQASFTRPASASTSSDEPTLTTTRRKSVSDGSLRHDLLDDLSDMGPARSGGTSPTGTPRLQPLELLVLRRVINHGERLHRHVGLDLRRVARAVLSEGCPEKGLAALVRRAIPDGRDQPLVLSHAVARGGAGVGGADAEGLRLRLEGVEVHHPLEAAVGQIGQQHRADRG